MVIIYYMNINICKQSNKMKQEKEVLGVGTEGVLSNRLLELGSDYLIDIYLTNPLVDVQKRRK